MFFCFDLSTKTEKVNLILKSQPKERKGDKMPTSERALLFSLLFLLIGNDACNIYVGIIFHIFSMGFFIKSFIWHLKEEALKKRILQKTERKGD